MKPQHFVISYLMGVSVTVEIIQKEHDVGCVVTEKWRVYIAAEVRAHVCVCLVCVGTNLIWCVRVPCTVGE